MTPDQELAALTARVKELEAERDRTLGVKDRAVKSAAENKQEADALRARVAELERDHEQYRADFREQQKKLTERERELAKTTAALQLTKQLRKRVEQRNAELVAAQGFPRDYRFTGRVQEITKQIGNAVPRRLARALVAAAIRQDADVGFLEQFEQGEAA